MTSQPEALNPSVQDALQIIDYIDTSMRRRNILLQLGLLAPVPDDDSYDMFHRLRLDQIKRVADAALSAIGGIHAVIEDDDSSKRVVLHNWLGPDELEPDKHSWLSIIGPESKAVLSFTHAALRMDLEDERRLSLERPQPVADTEPPSHTYL